MAYQDAFKLLVDLGLVDVILPFILVFIVVFGILQKTKVLGEEHDKKPRRKLNAMVAFVLGFISVLAANTLNIISVFAKYFVLALVVVLMVALIFGLAGIQVGKGKAFKAIAVVLFILAMLFALSELGIISQERFFTYLLPLLAMAGIIGGVAYALARKGGGGKEEAPKAAPKKTLTGEELAKGAQYEER